MILENIEELWDKYPEIKYFDYLRRKHDKETNLAFKIRDRVLDPPIILPESVMTKMPDEKDIQFYIDDGYPKADATGAINMLRVIHCYEFFEQEIEKMLSE